MIVAAFGEPMPKLMIVRPASFVDGLHRPVVAVDIAGETSRETLHVVAKIREQHVIAEAIERHARVAGEPVGGDFDLGDHLRVWCFGFGVLHANSQSLVDNKYESINFRVRIRLPLGEQLLTFLRQHTAGSTSICCRRSGAIRRRAIAVR